VPAAQFVHPVAAVKPVPPKNVPIAQTVHVVAVAALYVPAAQAVHVTVPVTAA